MQNGLSNQLTRQIGEHLIAAKPGRMGCVASPFAGNVPLFDILAADARGRSIPIQVKAINGPSWQYQADTFLEIELIDDFQHVRGKKPLLNPNLVCIYIYILLNPNERDEFYIFRLRDHTHFTAAGAGLIARCVVAGLKALKDDPLAPYLKEEKP
jgi:lysophospholipase L1-like esterase